MSILKSLFVSIFCCVVVHMAEIIVKLVFYYHLFNRNLTLFPALQLVVICEHGKKACQISISAKLVDYMPDIKELYFFFGWERCKILLIFPSQIYRHLNCVLHFCMWICTSGRQFFPQFLRNGKLLAYLKSSTSLVHTLLCRQFKRMTKLHLFN